MEVEIMQPLRHYFAKLFDFFQHSVIDLCVSVCDWNDSWNPNRKNLILIQYFEVSVEESLQANVNDRAFELRPISVFRSDKINESLI